MEFCKKELLKKLMELRWSR